MENAIMQAYTHAYNWIGPGQTASYIPQLKKIDPNLLSVCICTTEGVNYNSGDSKFYFTIQSISKVIILSTALKHLGFDDVFSNVGMEPTGDPFNSIVRLEGNEKKPSNPLINSGAIAVVACLYRRFGKESYNYVLNEAKLLLGNKNATYDNSVYLSESATGDKNRALAYMLKSNGAFDEDVDSVLDIYFKTCSIQATCEQLAYFGAVLANNGRCPDTNSDTMPSASVKSIVSLMSSCGMYDASGKHALKVGVPSKSGVGGGILSCVPGKMGVATFSPALDTKGNSLCGIKALEKLSELLALSIFNP